MLDLLDPRDEPALLDSSGRHAEYGRYGILACRPLEVLTLRGDVLTGRAGETRAKGAEPVWQQLGRALAPIAEHHAGPQPYAPGWIGYVGYEVGRLVEHLPARAPRDTALPDLRLAFYDAILVADTTSRQAWLVELKFDAPAPPGAGEAAELLRTVMTDRRAARRGDSRGEGVSPVSPTDADMASNFSPDAYRRAIARCVEYIAAGDIFQVNLSQRFEARDAPDPRATYRALRVRNPASHAAFLEFFGRDDKPCAILSSSPELFLRVRGRRVVTRPIKGTRGRSGDEGVDAAARSDLLASPKDNAELAMIVDLLRNDLGRVCEYGSIRVTEPATLEEHPTVYHLVATVAGELRDGVGQAELLRATFPGGSITGAPKIRAMEIIDELEPVARGVYTGCIGIVGADGDCEWNIAIRTMICDDGRAFVQAGGGIVADSRPDDEYEETLHKARALIEAVGLARR